MHVVVCEELGGLSGEWDDLVAAQPLPSPFLRSWWLGSAATGRPRLLCCMEDDRLVGGAAFETDRLGPGPGALERVRCLGQGGLAPDHLDLIAAPERRAEVTAAVLSWLRRPGARLVDLDGLAADGALAGALGGTEISRIGAPWTPLPADGEEYVAARPGKLRSTITRTARRLAKEGVTVHRVTPEEADAALDALAELHEGRWADESAFLADWVRFRPAARAGMAGGDVVIHELRTAGGEVVATELDLRVGDRLAFYQAGRRTEREWRGAGSALKADIVRWACGAGCAEFDLLRGDESYKSDWADRRREVLRVRLGVGTRGRAVAAAARLWVAAAPRVDALRRRLRREPVSPAAG